MTRTDVDTSKTQRALELFEKGLEAWQIAERLGISERQVSNYVAHARRRNKRKAEA